MKNIIPLIFFLIVLVDAIVNWYLIEKKNRKIKHWVEASWYVVICIAVSCILYFIFKIKIVHLIAFSLLTRLCFFDPLLLLFRKEKLSYEGDPNKPEKEKSFYDKIEKWFGIDIIWLRLIYLILYTGYLIYYLIEH